MTNYYSHTSADLVFQIPKDSEAARLLREWIALIQIAITHNTWKIYELSKYVEIDSVQHSELMEILLWMDPQGTEDLITDPSALCLPLMEFKESSDSVFLHIESAETFNPGIFATLLSRILAKLGYTGRVGFTYADVADASIPGAFGGGAFVISADKVDFMDAQTWLHNQLHPAS